MVAAMVAREFTCVARDGRSRVYGAISRVSRRIVPPQVAETHMIPQAERVVFGRKETQSVEDQLGTVPLFVVADREGRLAHQKVDPEPHRSFQETERILLDKLVAEIPLFVSYYDAEKAARAMGISEEVKIQLTTLAQLYPKLFEEKTVHNSGQVYTVRHRIVCDDFEVKQASKLFRQKGIKKEDVPVIPVFQVRELHVRGDHHDRALLYLSMNDLLKQVKTVKPRDGQNDVAEPEVTVYDLVTLLKQRRVGKGMLAKEYVEIVPSSRNLNMIERLSSP